MLTKNGVTKWVLYFAGPQVAHEYTFNFDELGGGSGHSVNPFSEWYLFLQIPGSDFALNAKPQNTFCSPSRPKDLKELDERTMLRPTVSHLAEHIPHCACVHICLHVARMLEPVFEMCENMAYPTLAV